MVSLPRVLAAVGLVLTVSTAHAARSPSNFQFVTSVENTTVTAGSPFNLECVITSDGRTALDDLQLPDTGELQVLGQNRSEGTSVNIGPGGASYKRTLRITLTLVAPATGTYRIGAGSVRLGRERASSEPLTIRAVGGAAPPPGTPGGGPADNTVPGATSSPGVRASPQMVKAGIFATLEADRTTVMLGEQVSLTVRIFSRADLSDIDALRLPKLEGFWTEELENPRRIAPTMAVVDGQRYQAYLLRRLAVFPTRAGTFELPAVEAEVTVGGSFFSAGRRQRVQSLPLELTVEPLPAEGQPPGFNAGNVGTFTLEARLDRDRTTTAQPVTLTVRIRGTGNLRQAAVPRLPEMADLRTYDPTPSEDIQVRGDRFVGSKTLEYLLQPKKAGTFTLPTLSFHFYDTDARAYRTVQAPPLTLVVTGEGAAATGTVPSGNVLNVGARPPRSRVRESSSTPLASKVLPVPVVVGGPALLALGSLLGGAWVRRRRATAGTDRGALARQATRELLEAARTGHGVDGVTAALHAYLQARLGAEVMGMTRDELRRHCAPRITHPGDTERLVRLLDQLDMARYAPVGTARPDVLAEEAVAVVRSLEAALGDSP